MQLEVDGSRLEALWTGPGPEAAPTLVFLHEGLGSAGQWRDFPARLAVATGCGALVYSRLGYGASDPRPFPWPVAFMHEEARVLPRVLDAMGIERAILVGHSDGGSIALIHAGGDGADRGDRIVGLALEAAHVFVEPVTVESIAALPPRYEAELRERLARHHGANTDSAFRGWTDVWLRPEFRRWNIEEHLPGVVCPVLVIQGEDDPYGTIAQVAAIRAEVSGPVETVLLPACGHAPHKEKPEETLAAMAGFVRRVLAA